MKLAPVQLLHTLTIPHSGVFAEWGKKQVLGARASFVCHSAGWGSRGRKYEGKHLISNFLGRIFKKKNIVRISLESTQNYQIHSITMFSSSRFVMIMKFDSTILFHPHHHQCDKWNVDDIWEYKGQQVALWGDYCRLYEVIPPSYCYSATSDEPSLDKKDKS